MSQKTCEKGASTMCKQKLRPLSDRVLLQRLPKEGQVGSIFLPEGAQQKKEKARVVAVGSGKLDKQGNRQPMPVEEGQIVLIEKYSGQELKLHGEEYIVVRASEIIAIVEE